MTTNWPAMSIAEAHALLTAPGSPLEMETVVIRGRPTRTWKNAPPTLRDVFIAGRAHDDKIFLVHEDERVSFEAFARATLKLAAQLRADGVVKGDRVAVVMRNLPEWPVAFFAATLCGAIVTPLNAWWTGAELEYGLSDSGTKVLLVDAERLARLTEHLPNCPSLERIYVTRTGDDFGPEGGNPLIRRLDSVIGAPDSWGALPAGVLPDVAIEPEDDATIFYTSGTTGKPKGVQRDTGGYLVALAASMKHIFMGEPGETYFSTSDIGWVVGHSYIVYGPLIAGMATILYEGLPIRPDGGIWWRLVEKYKVTVMFSAPTAVRVLKKQDPAYLKQYDLSSLKALFLAGEPLDEPTARWISEGLGVPIIDNYWQTESGWPILTIANGLEKKASKFGSPGVPMYGYSVKLLHESTGEELTGADEKGVVVIEGPTPPGFMQTVWKDDARFVNTYWKSIPGKLVYSTFDWGIRDQDGYFYILGRTDDVINVAGHRLGTREIEESISSHANVAEVAVVGVADQLKGQVAMAFVVARDTSALDEAAKLKLEGEIMKRVDDQLGAVARPARVRFVTVLPKTRSGKLLRRAIQAVCEGRDPGDLTTMDDPAALQQINALLVEL